MRVIDDVHSFPRRLSIEAPGRCGDWIAPPPSPPGPELPADTAKRGMGTFNWPPAGPRPGHTRGHSHGHGQVLWPATETFTSFGPVTCGAARPMAGGFFSRESPCEPPHQHSVILALTIWP